jgi:hypothetical protein
LKKNVTYLMTSILPGRFSEEPRLGHTVIDWVNRWGTGTKVLVKGPMRVIYSEKKLMLSQFLKLSRAL